MKNLVSIIIPITDLENYTKSISNLNLQSYSEMEIVCIINNSKIESKDIDSIIENKSDNTLILENEFEEEETAWNYGLKNSNGKYILFLTENSIIEKEDFIKDAMEALDGSDLDLVFYPIQAEEKRENDNEKSNAKYDKIYLNNDNKLSSINNVLNNFIFNHEDILEVIFEIPSICINKIFKKSFLEENNISFNEDSEFSSILFYYETVLKAKRMAYLKKNSIKLLKDQSKDLNSKDNCLSSEYFETILEIKENLKELSIFNQYKKHFYKKFIPHIFYQFYLIDEDKKEEGFNLIKKYLPRIINEDEENQLDFNAQNVLNDFKADKYYGNLMNEDLKALFESDEIKSFTIRHYKKLERLYDVEEEINLSVVMPVFNSEEYLNECLDSILNQTLDNIEIICIDDRSTDNSLDILKGYAEKYDNIKVFRNDENKGAGFTRNRGLSYINGKYFAFMDSDDFLDETAYEKVLDLVKSNDLDFAMFQLINYNDDTGEVYTESYYDIKCLGDDYTEKVFNHKDTIDVDGMFKISVSPCNKIYKRSFIEEIDARFKEGITFEDNIFFFKIFLKAERVSFYKEHLYYRRRRNDSVMGSYNKNNVNVILISSMAVDLFQEEGYYDLYKENLLNFKINACRNRLNQTDDEHKPYFYKIMHEDFVKQIDYTFERRLNEIYYKRDFKKVLTKKNFTFYRDVLKYSEYDEFNEVQKLRNKSNKLNKENKALKKDSKKLKNDAEKAKKDNKKLKNEMKTVKSTKGWIKYKNKNIYNRLFKK
ncbi:glycosyltransferase [uncultured Methanobrevibacter sp.]|uniref:glycosyltransferase family 2 protein n=1 Tax=uncultured Methanobrevibacter sp. TaxID=253161 RepID=UPI0025EC5DA0|nr:glycosyltransferase [uncultured Methanobrevibacter sp.]